MTTDTNYIEIAINLSNDGKNIGQIEGYLRYKYNLTVAQSKRVIKDANLSGKKSSADWSDTVEYLIKNIDKLSKIDLINGMCELNSKTYLTNQHAYNYIPMAREWAKQMTS